MQQLAPYLASSAPWQQDSSYSRAGTWGSTVLAAQAAADCYPASRAPARWALTDHIGCLLQKASPAASPSVAAEWTASQPQFVELTISLGARWLLVTFTAMPPPGERAALTARLAKLKEAGTDELREKAELQEALVRLVRVL